MNYMKPGNRIKRLRDELNRNHEGLYMIRSIDLEVCLYRRLDPFFDLEISGVNTIDRPPNRRNAAAVYLWMKPEGRSPFVVASEGSIPEERIHETCQRLDDWRKKIEAVYSGNLCAMVDSLPKVSK